MGQDAAGMPARSQESRRRGLLFQLQAHFAEEDACEWRWLRRAAAGDAWQEIEGASERRYVPAAEDVGCELQVECRPARRCVCVWKCSSQTMPSHTLTAQVPQHGWSWCHERAAGASHTLRTLPTCRRSDPAGGDEAWLVFGEPASASTGPVRPAPGPLGAAPRLEQTQERARPPEFRVVSLVMVVVGLGERKRGYQPARCIMVGGRAHLHMVGWGSGWWWRLREGTRTSLRCRGVWLGANTPNTPQRHHRGA